MSTWNQLSRGRHLEMELTWGCAVPQLSRASPRVAAPVDSLRGPCMLSLIGDEGDTPPAGKEGAVCGRFHSLLEPGASW